MQRYIRGIFTKLQSLNQRKLSAYKIANKCLEKELVREEIVKKWNRLKNETTKEGEAIITEEYLENARKLVKISSTDHLRVKDVLLYLQYFRFLYGDHNDPVTFEFPVDGKKVEVTLKNNKILKPNGKRGSRNKVKFEICVENKPLSLKNLSNDLNEILKDTLKGTIPIIYDARLDSVGEFNKQLTGENERNEETGVSEEAFRQAFGFIASCNFRVHELNDDWLRPICANLKDEQQKLENKLMTEIRTTKIKSELFAKMQKTSKQVKERWDQLKNDGIVETEPNNEEEKGVITKVEFKKTDQITVMECFELLQFLLQIYPDLTCEHRVEIIIPIGNTGGNFYLARAPHGKEQLLVTTIEQDGPESYANLFENVLSRVRKPAMLAKVMLTACKSSLDNQPNLIDAIVKSMYIGVARKGVLKPVTRSCVAFLAITMIAEAAAPLDITKELFIKNVARKCNKNERFPDANEMPSLENMGHYKSGRNPVNAQMTAKLLESIARAGNERGFDEFFTSDAGYPARGQVLIITGKPEGGTMAARRYIHEHGDKAIPSHALRELPRAKYCKPSPK